MWYFAWILGASLAVLLAVVNAMLCEARENLHVSAPANAGEADAKPPSGGRSQCAMNSSEEG